MLIKSHDGSISGMFTYIWLKFMVNVGKYTSPMDPSWEMIRLHAGKKEIPKAIPSLKLTVRS